MNRSRAITLKSHVLQVPPNLRSIISYARAILYRTDANHAGGWWLETWPCDDPEVTDPDEDPPSYSEPCVSLNECAGRLHAWALDEGKTQ